MSEQKYYLPEPSYWPFIGSIGLFTTLFGFGHALVFSKTGVGNLTIMYIGFAILAFMLFGWFGTVIRESEGGKYNSRVDTTFRLAMMWFIFSEVMFFSAFFGALFYARELSVPWLGGADPATHLYLWDKFKAAWPLLHNPDPKAFQGAKEGMDASGIALINTIILLSSSVTVTIAHHALKANKRGVLTFWLLVTVLLGFTFLGFQVHEYVHAYEVMGLKLSSGIYGTTFFMLTGFHGLHVTIGATMLTVMLLRVIKGHFKPDHHFAFEAASWYWHFVDVVWVGLFIFVYWL
jgi:cytochrome c oxidase subunit 3